MCYNIPASEKFYKEKKWKINCPHREKQGVFTHLKYNLQIHSTAKRQIRIDNQNEKFYYNYAKNDPDCKSEPTHKTNQENKNPTQNRPTQIKK